MENPSGKTAKEVRDESHRDAKLEEQVLKSLTGIPDAEGKLQGLLKKYVELEKENKKLNSGMKLQEKRFEALLREKDNLQKDHNKNILMRTKLEQVCREQQKLLKSVQSESVKHKETQAKFQHSINEISSTLSKNNDENLKLKEDNIDMAKKLKYLAEQYQVREKQLEKINEQVQLEDQLHEAKLAKIQMEATIEKEILLREKQNSLDELLKCKKSMQDMQKREEALKEQLCLYTSKYDDFQMSLQKSNDIFASYKTEMDKMIKKTKKLEKESSEWKRKCEKSTASLLDLATERQAKDEYIGKTARQMQQLQKLLRTLQAERTTLHKTLKDNNIEIPAMPTLPPEPEPVPIPQPKQQPDKIDVMAKNCAELKQSLAFLQSQMTKLSAQENSNAASAPAAERPTATESTKSRNKKSKTRNKSCPTKEKTQVEIAKKDAPIESSPQSTIEGDTIVEITTQTTENGDIESVAVTEPTELEGNNAEVKLSPVDILLPKENLQEEETLNGDSSGERISCDLPNESIEIEAIDATTVMTTTVVNNDVIAADANV